MPPALEKPRRTDKLAVQIVAVLVMKKIEKQTGNRRDLDRPLSHTLSFALRSLSGPRSCFHSPPKLRKRAPADDGMENFVEWPRTIGQNHLSPGPLPPTACQTVVHAWSSRSLRHLLTSLALVIRCLVFRAIAKLPPRTGNPLGPGRHRIEEETSRSAGPQP